MTTESVEEIVADAIEKALPDSSSNDIGGAVITALTERGYAIEEGWRDIGSAPKDGTEVLVLAGRQIAVAKYSRFLEWHLAHTGSWAEDADLDDKPTMWRPLPAAPGGSDAEG